MLICQRKGLFVMKKIIDEYDYRLLTVKIDMIIEYLKNNGGIDHEVDNFICVASYEEISRSIVDFAFDIKNKIDFLYKYDDSEDCFL